MDPITIVLLVATGGATLASGVLTLLSRRSRPRSTHHVELVVDGEMSDLGDVSPAEAVSRVEAEFARRDHPSSVRTART
jgi:hypothetical protein